MTGQQTLVEYLKALHVEKGSPPLRVISKATDIVGSMVHNMLKGNRLSAWERVEAMLVFFEGDVEHGRTLWEKMIAARTGTPEVRVPAVDHGAETNRLLGLMVGQLAEILSRMPS